MRKRASQHHQSTAAPSEHRSTDGRPASGSIGIDRDRRRNGEKKRRLSDEADVIGEPAGVNATPKSQNHTHLHTHTGTEHRGKRGSDRTQTTHTPEPSPRQPKHRPARADPGGPRRRPRSVTPLTPAARGRLSPGPPPPHSRPITSHDGEAHAHAHAKNKSVAWLASSSHHLRNLSGFPRSDRCPHRSRTPTCTRTYTRYEFYLPTSPVLHAPRRATPAGALGVNSTQLIL